jgi:hypothetical protein
MTLLRTISWRVSLANYSRHLMFAWSQPLESITERDSARECSTDKRYNLFLNSVYYTKKFYEYASIFMRNKF